VKFGHRAKDYTDLADMYKKTRAEGFGDEVKRRIMIGTYVLSHGYYDAYYLQAQKIRRMIADDFQNAFKDCDVIAGPVAPRWPGRWVPTATRWPTTWPTSSPCPARWPACPA
jgi:aspartyl-tRNA(Asn)/glutamyl-tRNA(Gln) amidotransferase subunit A